MNPSRYLGRIGVQDFAGPPDATRLDALTQDHLLAVPFENLSIIGREHGSLSREWFYQKIVVERRGGICCEINGLFEWLLAQLGYETSLLSARAIREGGHLGPEFDHMVLGVRLDKLYVVDAGFGGAQPACALPVNGEVRQSLTGEHRVREVGSDHYALERWEHGRWVSVYQFSLRARQLQDFQAMYEFHRTSPDAPFNQQVFCTRPTLRGRLTLAGTSFTITEDGVRHRTPIHDEEERARILWEWFNCPPTYAPSGTEQME